MVSVPELFPCNHTPENFESVENLILAQVLLLEYRLIFFVSMRSFAFYLVLMSSSLNVDAYITVREDTKHTQLAVHQDSSSSKAERGKSTEERNKYGGILDAGAGKAWALGTFVTLLMAGCSAFRVGDMATFLQSLGDISAESAQMKNVRLWLAQCMINNGLNHIAIIVWSAERHLCPSGGRGLGRSSVGDISKL